MADVHSKEIRSYNMSQIKGKNTKQIDAKNVVYDKTR